jgi:hypothetical protein
MSEFQQNLLIRPLGPENPLQTVGPYGPIKSLTSKKDNSSVAIQLQGMSKLQLAPLTPQGNPLGDARTGSLEQVIPSLDDVEESSDEFALSDYGSDDESEPTYHWKYIG